MARAQHVAGTCFESASQVVLEPESRLFIGFTWSSCGNSIGRARDERKVVGVAVVLAVVVLMVAM